MAAPRLLCGYGHHGSLAPCSVDLVVWHVALVPESGIPGQCPLNTRFWNGRTSAWRRRISACKIASVSTT